MSNVPRSAVLAGVAALALGAAPIIGEARSAEPPKAAERAFGRWAVVCDNTLACQAVGGTSDNATPGYVKVVRSPADRDPVISVGVDHLAYDWGKPLRVSLDITAPDGRPLLHQDRVMRDDGYAVTQITLSPTPRVVAAVAEGAVLRVRSGKGDDTSIDLTGSAAALRWMDERQGWAGAQGALVAKGVAWRRPVPPRPAVVIRRAPAVSQARLPKPFRALVAMADEACRGFLDGKAALKVHRLSPGRLLWIAECEDGGAYNIFRNPLLTDEAGRRLPGPFVEGVDQYDELENLTYDPATRTLASAFYFRFMKDCGYRTEWVWDGRRFRRSKILGADDEHAVFGGWPVRWRAEVR